MQIEIIEGYRKLEEVKDLFREYSKMPGAEKCFMTFEKELENLPGEYARPQGRILSACIGDDMIGCVALKRVDDCVCEIKRLFVKEKWRKKGAGVLLLNSVLAEALEEQYEKVILETLPIMNDAIMVYKRSGFTEMEEIDGIIKMQKNLLG